MYNVDFCYEYVLYLMYTEVNQMTENIQVSENIIKIKNTLESFSLPSWDELPSIYLYMDQVIELTSQYFRSVSELVSEDKILTPPMINNYIKLKAMPAPDKKRYGKIHLAYLLMISSLKQTMNISAMKNVIPLLESEEDVQKLYTSFVRNLDSTMKTLGESIAPALNLSGKSEINKDDAIMQIVIASNFMKVFSSGMLFSPAEDTKKSSEENVYIKEEEK